MSEKLPSVNDEVFLFTKETRAKKSSGENWKLFKERVAKEIKGIKWVASKFDIAEKVAELLDIKIPSIFISSWKKSEEIKKIIEDSIKSPEEKFEVNLSEHTITSEHKPYIELMLKNVQVYKIEFDLNLSFTLDSFMLKIQNGIIYGIDPGVCNAQGTLSWEKIKLLEKKSEPIKIPGTIHLNSTNL
jgi:hypothetical protein